MLVRIIQAIVLKVLTRVFDLHQKLGGGRSKHKIRFRLQLPRPQYLTAWLGRENAWLAPCGLHCGVIPRRGNPNRSSKIMSHRSMVDRDYRSKHQNTK